MNKKFAITSQQFNQAFAALTRYERRQARTEHPAGSFDNARRWYPSGRDEDVMEGGRSPSRAYPNAYNLACRSLGHCERYEEADHQVVLLLKRELKKADLEATTEGASEALRAALLDKSLPAASADASKTERF
ncbi:hypothetical protein [Xanthomonas arboricola]|uniref:Uncharacterized protein n=1 Tax=Xanthomonas arboricola pv. corylina TaxID=487821 RepID=A0ABM8SKQ2_9XANT|nr:hypothetical protein [Xanthomonas arboricola]MDN0209832.1 hypothetical protein [Xanthomonas arboricola pv. corylina]MDN0214151.1 hypothetical protein [Xanthomonas arboricola pv. corylina]MDN0218324.1 hypothetical protein [Xanthomonas arboricola pv. corylina]QUI79758.1 hypothetical protein ICA18_16100 [Xanthomonas arboricola pv. corylina]UQQ11856.1 hypothetical protein KP021_06470 [Xanthomonas arboricola pv. corylina]